MTDRKEIVSIILRLPSWHAELLTTIAKTAGISRNELIVRMIDAAPWTKTVDDIIKEKGRK